MCSRGSEGLSHPVRAEHLLEVLPTAGLALLVLVGEGGACRAALAMGGLALGYGWGCACAERPASGCAERGDGRGEAGCGGVSPGFPSPATMFEMRFIGFTVKVYGAFLEASHCGNSCAGSSVAGVWFAGESLSQMESSSAWVTRGEPAGGPLDLPGSWRGWLVL